MRHRAIVATLALALAVSGRSWAANEPHSLHAKDATRAVVLLQPISGSRVQGTVTFTRTPEGLLVSGHLTGLTPNAKHGIHVHELGDCGSDGKNAGSHFAPEGGMHGGPTGSPRHAGDLGNVVADAQGHGQVEVTVRDLAIGSGDAMILGRALVVHAQADDLTSQPSGSSGDRVACGVIGIAPAGDR